MSSMLSFVYVFSVFHVIKHEMKWKMWVIFICTSSLKNLLSTSENLTGCGQCNWILHAPNKQWMEWFLSWHIQHYVTKLKISNHPSSCQIVWKCWFTWQQQLIIILGRKVRKIEVLIHIELSPMELYINSEFPERMRTLNAAEEPVQVDRTSDTNIWKREEAIGLWGPLLVRYTVKHKGSPVKRMWVSDNSPVLLVPSNELTLIRGNLMNEDTFN